MKGKLLIFVLVVFNWVFLQLNSDALAGEEDHHEHHHEEVLMINRAAVGPHQAVTDASAELGFKLSKPALDRLGIQMQNIKGPAPYRLPQSAMVFYQDQVGVYRHQNGWFRLITVRVRKRNQANIHFDSPELEEGDSLVTRGVSFLRVAEMEVFGEASGGHVH